MTAAEYQTLAASTGEETARVEAATTHIRAFDYDAPLPPLRIQPREQIWEPAARRYRDLTDDERNEQEEQA